MHLIPTKGVFTAIVKPSLQTNDSFASLIWIATVEFPESAVLAADVIIIIFSLNYDG